MQIQVTLPWTFRQIGDRTLVFDQVGDGSPTPLVNVDAIASSLGKGLSAESVDVIADKAVNTIFTEALRAHMQIRFVLDDVSPTAPEPKFGGIAIR